MRKKERRWSFCCKKSFDFSLHVYYYLFFKVIPFIYSASLLVSNCNNKKERVIHNLLLFQHQHDILHSDIQRENILIYFCTKKYPCLFFMSFRIIKKTRVWVTRKQATLRRPIFEVCASGNSNLGPDSEGGA